MISSGRIIIYCPDELLYRPDDICFSHGTYGPPWFRHETSHLEPFCLMQRDSCQCRNRRGVHGDGVSVQETNVTISCPGPILTPSTHVQREVRISTSPILPPFANHNVTFMRFIFTASNTSGRHLTAPGS